MFWAVSFSVAALAALALLPSVINGRLRALHIAKKLTLISIVSAAPPLLVNRAFGASRLLEEWLVQYFMSLVVTSLVIVSVYTVYRATRSPKLENTTEALDRRAKYCTKQFLKRLPIQYQTAELYAVSSEDHYLKVHTSLGNELILMRLSDALIELGDADGQQTHRSWWVARQGIVQTKKSNNKINIELKSGEVAPVSRTYSKAVRDAGFMV